MTTAPIAYAHELAPATDAQIRTWQVFPATAARPLTVTGACPACDDQCEVPIIDIVVQGGAPAAYEAAPVSHLTRQIICNCRVDHQSPAGVPAGCGRYWLATLSLKTDGDYTMAVERDLQLLPAATALNEAARSQDKRVQATAEKWLGAVTGIYGLFSLTGIATAKDALVGLSGASKWLVALALLAGLATAGSALVLGYLAAYGWPRAVEVNDNEQLKLWYAALRDYSKTAAQRLQAAILLTFGSLACLSVVMLLVWFLPRHGK